MGVPEASLYTHDGFDRIRDNPDVDIVYIVLPNALHAEFTIRVAEAGKHVLCEKPMAASVEQAQWMVDTYRAAGRRLMIAYRLQYTPEHRTVIEMARSRTYGAVRLIALAIPAVLRPEVAAPILCAGVTTYSPMKHRGMKAGDRVGFGGLGDMAAKLARAMGAELVVFTRSEEKLAQAECLGVTVVLVGDRQAMAGCTNSFDFMLDTVPEKHDVSPYVAMLKRDCTLAVVGAIEPLASENNQERVMHRKSVAGSLIGSIAETREVLEFCATRGVGPDIEVIPIQQINHAYRMVEKGEVRFRYVIDMASLRQEAAA